MSVRTRPFVVSALRRTELGTEPNTNGKVRTEKRERQRSLRYCAPATRSGAGGTTKAVWTNDDATAGKGGRRRVEDVLRRFGHRAEFQHLVEVAVVQPAIPTDRQRVPAHQTVDSGWIAAGREAVHVVLQSA